MSKSVALLALRDEAFALAVKLGKIERKAFAQGEWVRTVQASRLLRKAISRVHRRTEKALNEASRES